MRQLNAKHLILAGCLTCSLALVAGAPQAKADELSDLKAQIQALTNKVEALQAQQKAQATQMAQQEKAAAPANAVTAGSVPGSFKLPGTDTSIKIGGYVKVDGLYHVKGYGNQDFLDTTSTPLDGTAAASKKGNTKLDAKQTRLNVETDTPTGWGNLKTYVEFDFYGSGGNEQNSNSYGPRLRHAYGELGPFLAGQTDSLFRDTAAEPETLDFGEDSGLNQIRQAQFRYTYQAGNGVSAAVSVENPETEYSTLAGKFRTDTGGTLAFDHLPDLVGALKVKQSWGHLALRGVARQLSLNNGTTTKIHKGAYGIGVSGNLMTFGKDNLLGEFNYGDGIGRYIVDAGGQAAAYNAATNSLETQTAWGAAIGYQHWWMNNLRSNISGGYTHIDNNSTVFAGCSNATCPNKQIETFHINTIWSPIKNFETGIEYIYARRKVENGAKGKEDTIQVSAKYKF